VLSTLIVAVGLVLFVEGALYALFPEAMKKMMVSVLDTPSHILRIFGILAAIVGVVIVWLVQG
jgi:uncharacterized protein YjeT (DUF2065 family)